MRSVATKLLLMTLLPSLAAGSIGLWVLYGLTDRTVRDATRRDSVQIADLISTSFNFTHKTDGSQPREAHPAVTALMRSDWVKDSSISGLRVIDRNGIVRWSIQVEEEGHPLADAARLLQAAPGTVSFEEPIIPGRGHGGEVVMPLGGVACAGCHFGESTMRAGVLQLQVSEQELRDQVSGTFLKAFAIMLALGAILLGFTALSLRLFLRNPLQRLAVAMKKAEEGDLLVRAREEGDDEVGALSKAFNRLLARLTEMKAEEIDHERDMAQARRELELKSKLEDRLTELSTLYDMSRALSSTIDLNEVLTRITELVPAKLLVPKFSVMLLNSEGLLEVRKSLPATDQQLTFALTEGVCGRAATDRRASYVSDLATDPLFKVRAERDEKVRGSLLAVPMVHGEELLGVLNFERFEKAAFAVDEIEFFTAVADQAAIAIKNAKLHEQTVNLSITDMLTGVANRRFLFQQLELEIARANRFGTQLSMLMIDIDFFKKLNDAAGHTAGDVVLKQVCTLMKNTVRKVDTLARYGGEEFVVLLPQVTKAEALEVADKLRRIVAESPIDYREVQPTGKVTISVGVANLPVDATEQHHLVDSADAALYASKRAGRDRVTGFAAGMEVHPGRERGPNAMKRRATGEIPVVAEASKK
ncbi:MAG: diguanylate cyclase [Myxococcaceae bacterium]